MIRVLITFLILLLFLPIFILMMITGIVLSYIMHPRYFYRSMHLGCKLLLLGGWQYHTIHGQVPPKNKGPYLFMFNHESMFDAFMLGASIPYYINAIGWEGIFKWPLWGFFAKRYGAYQITHDNINILCNQQLIKKYVRLSLKIFLGTIVFYRFINWAIY